MEIVKATVPRGYGYIVQLHLSDGSIVERDFSLLRGGVFDPILKSRKLFKRIAVRKGQLGWPGEVDLCSDAVLRGKIGTGRPAKFAIVGSRGNLISGKGVTTVLGTKKLSPGY